MTTQAAVDHHLKALTSVLDEYTHWYMLLLRYIQYPKDMQALENLEPPDSFELWLNNADRAQIGADTLERLEQVHEELVQKAHDLQAQAAKESLVPEYEDFDALTTLFEEFTLQIRRLETDMLAEGGGVDELTGLRNKAMLLSDYDKEMERVARQGKPFSIAVVRIQNLKDMRAREGEVLKLVSDLIKQCIRSFDDAYQVRSNEFVLSLKQTDADGGLKALRRLQELLALETGEMEDVPVLICCVSEPAPGDPLDQILTNIREELEAHGDAGSGIIEYMDISPLQRFVQQGGEG
ncbi:MAG: diguanylate cyclase [Alphaproteobacteria bacterium]|nr:diguanylate cyclase [Alphaproteobacteria bacterium]